MSKLAAVVGPTASGKTELGIKIAEEYNGEIICADSRTIYKGMDLGTAKPSHEQQQQIPHHLLDLIQPDQTFSASEFKDAAEVTINDIWRQKKLPVLVGGSGLYLYSLLYDYQFPAGARTKKRAELEQKPIGDLVLMLQELDPELTKEVDLKNPRRVIRAIETAGQPRTRARKLPKNYLLLGLLPPTDQLNKNIASRTKTMLRSGLVDEVKSLTERFGAEIEPLNTVGYREIIEHINGGTSLSEVEELINLHTRQLVRRQLTWFKRNPDIIWVQHKSEAMKVVKAFLAGL